MIIVRDAWKIRRKDKVENPSQFSFWRIVIYAVWYCRNEKQRLIRWQILVVLWRLLVLNYPVDSNISRIWLFHLAEIAHNKLHPSNPIKRITKSFKILATVESPSSRRWTYRLLFTSFITKISLLGFYLNNG